MAIKTVGFGGTGTSSYATLGSLIAEFAPERYENAINQAAPLIGSGALKKEKVDGEEWTHTLFGGAGHSTMVIRDAGRLPTGHAYEPTKLREQPANVVSVLKMGRRAAKAKLSDARLAEYFDSALEESSDDCGRVLARQLHGAAENPQAGTTWSGTAADSTATVSFNDISMFRPGAAYDFVDASSSKSYVVRCTGVTPSAVGSFTDAVSGTVDFINDVPDPVDDAVEALTDTTIATGDTFRIRGETAGFGGASTTIDTALVNFSDMAGTGTLHGTAASAYAGWAGNTKALSAAYSQEAVVQFMGRMHTIGGAIPDVVVMHPQVAAAHMANTGQQAAVWGLTAGISAARPMDVQASADKFGNIFENGGLRVGGARIVQDPNCPATVIVIFNSQKTKLAVWDEMGPDEESGDPMLLGRTFYDVGCQISGAYNLVTHRRNTVGRITGLTSL